MAWTTSIILGPGETHPWRFSEDGERMRPLHCLCSPTPTSWPGKTSSSGESSS